MWSLKEQCQGLILSLLISINIVYFYYNILPLLSFWQRVAASCIWLASKLEENIRSVRQVLKAFHKMENLPTELFDVSSKV